MTKSAGIELPLHSDRVDDSEAHMAEAGNAGGSTAPEITIRAARFDDLDGIEDLIEPFVDGGKLLPRTWDELQNLVPTGFVAECDERIVGFAALEIYSRKMGEIRSLCVADGFQGRGVGKRLVRACVDFATDRRVFEVMVVTSSEEFFQTCGFDFTLPGEKKALFLQTRAEP
jgi:amino-acid N-acetyltransferase